MQLMGQQSDVQIEVLAGLVERVTFHSQESGFCVLRLKARGHRELVTTVGHAAMISAGEWVTASGEWTNDRTHGQQFRARFLKTSAPSSIEGIEKYLGSGMIRGIGPVYAKRMVRQFGKDVFDIIEANPERLREVEGIGPMRAAKITSAWADQKVIREIMVFLHEHGVGTARAVRIFKTYGTDAVQVMSENPYRLARDIRGIGFRTADVIAEKLGVEKTAMIRVRAGISYALAEAMGDGHCGLPTGELVELAEKLLEVPEALIATAVDLEIAEGTVIADSVGETPCLFLSGLFHAEKGIADQLRRLLSGAVPWPEIDAQKALSWIEGRIGLKLAAEPGRGHRSGAERQGAGHHRRPRGRQDHHRELDLAHRLGQGRESSPLRPHGTGGQAHDRSDRHGGQDHPPPARVRPEDLRLQARRGEPARVRSAGDRRGLHGRCVAHAIVAEGRPRPLGPADRR